MNPAARTPEGIALWLTGEMRKPEYMEWYWTPDGPRQRQTYSPHREWPILSEKPALTDPYLVGRIDEVLGINWGESTNYGASRGKDLLNKARLRLTGKGPA